MSEWKIYHNPRCSKSRSALDILKEKGVEPTVVEYLTAPPSESELKALVAMLGIAPKEIVRTKDEGFAKLKLDLEDAAAVVKALAKHPELLERPIVVRGKKAVLGRPPEKILALF